MDESTALDFVRRLLPPERRAAVEAHLEGCSSCRRLVSAMAVALQSYVQSSDGAQETTVPFATLELPRAESPAPVDPEALGRGRTVGRYLVLDRLGSGGMGVVYTAYDPELDRRVALKLVRADASARADEPTRGARLLREAQAMARLSHPNVVAVYDVGAWGEHVFIAMERVEGGTLGQWLREKPRTWREVLEALISAGRGLAAAHAAGLVHRDFKPENVLVGRDGRVRVGDFGLVRAHSTLSDLEPATRELGVARELGSADQALTQEGATLGTPAFMAPEQHRGVEVDARSDQFSFCVTLYQALYGERPFPGTSREGVQRPPPKHARVPAWLLRVLLRGLSLRPEDRFPSMDALLEALSRDPWTARRRWLAAGAAAAVGLAIVLGAVRLARRDDLLCKGAERKLAGVWDEEVKGAARGAFLATGVPYAADAWQGTSRALDEYAGGWLAMHNEACEATRLRGEQSEELLARRMVCLERRRRELQALSALLRQSDAKAVERAQDAAGALSPVADCGDAEVLSAAAELPKDPVARAKVEELHSRLADAKALLGAAKYKQGLELAEPAAAEARQVGVLSLQAEASLLLAALHKEAGEYAPAETAYLDAARAAVAVHEDATAAGAFLELAFVVGTGKVRYPEAYRWLGFAQTLAEGLGGKSELPARVHRVRAIFYREQGKPADAAEEVQESLALAEAVLGKDHPSLWRTYSQLGALRMEQGQDAQAAEHFQRALVLAERETGPEHPNFARVLNNLCVLKGKFGRKADALVECERVLALRLRLLGPEHPEIAASLNNVAMLLNAQGRYTEALDHGRRAVAVAEKVLGPTHPNLAYGLSNVGEALKGLARYEEAFAAFARAHAVVEKAFGPGHPRVALQLESLGELRAAQRRHREALAYHHRSLGIIEKALGADHPSAARPLEGIGEAQLALGAPREAVGVLERAVRIQEEKASAPEDLARTRFLLARAFWESRQDRPRARRLAEAAVPPLREEGEEELLRQVQGWLESHRLR